ncbi:hypothetical protein [Achromobacter sp. ACM05]|uniref:hypothetical protein n=1 Tax=Achromobacter sp. ACM05 TaxID=2854776 RepID=UPI001C443B05|nr:hypothetical protein [Achromobacter sp. ACM05]MBV7502084.1 hypothetical protein [Achromobacter sp. ACM05]
MGALLPKWAMGDPALVCERLEELRRRPQKPRLSRQEIARQGLEQLFSEDHMTKDESEQLEELLMTWYHWEKAQRDNLGYRAVAPGFQGVSDLDGYGDTDETDAKINRYIGQQVALCVAMLDLELRVAIGFSMKNKDAPNKVFINPRCSREEQHRRYQEAKDKLLPMLRRRDLIKQPVGA